MPFALELAGTGTAKNEDKLALDNKTVNLVEQFGDFGYLIDDDQRASGLVDSVS